MSKPLPQKKFMHYREAKVPMPDLVAPQVASFRTFVSDGLKALFKEFSPIIDYSKKKFELEFVSFELGEPKVDEYGAKENKMTYDAPLKATVRLTNKTMGSKKDQAIFLADFPIMTEHGTFIINGVERVIVPQLARSFGVFFNSQELKGKKYFGAKVIPGRGAWLEFESDADGVIYVRIDRKRKFPITSLLRVVGLLTDKDIMKAFKDSTASKILALTLEKDPAKTASDSYIEIYKRLRDGDLATAENAKGFVDGIFSPERYDLSPVGRFRFNRRFLLPLEGKEVNRK